MEEPENGIHPERIPAMIQLLRDLTTEVQEQDLVGDGNQLRQVIINTHSPSVVMQVPEDSLVLAEPVEISRDKVSFKALQLRCLPGTWREKSGILKPISRGQLLAYLNPVSHAAGNGWDGNGREQSASDNKRSRRVIDREDLRQYKIPFSEISQ
jgi:hypothetical protein